MIKICLRAGPISNSQVSRHASGNMIHSDTTKRQKANEIGGTSASAGLVMGKAMPQIMLIPAMMTSATVTWRCDVLCIRILDKADYRYYTLPVMVSVVVWDDFRL